MLVWRVLRTLALWVLATFLVAALAGGLEIVGQRLMVAAKVDEAPVAFLYVGYALEFTAKRVLLAPTRPAMMAGWSPASVDHLALLSVAVWGGLLLIGARFFLARRRRTRTSGR